MQEPPQRLRQAPMKCCGAFQSNSLWGAITLDHHLAGRIAGHGSSLLR
jgi:hypothetical protein